MNADTERWPHLKLPTHPVLDWHETVYAQAQLLEMAHAIANGPHTIRAAGGGVWDTAIVAVLTALAGNSKALVELNRRKPTLPARVVGLNRAVHVHVLAELDPQCKKAAILRDVANTWGVTDGQVKDDVSAYSVVDPGPADAVRSIPYRQDDAKRLTLEIVHVVCTTSGRPRVEVLRDFDADMRHRAADSRRKK